MCIGVDDVSGSFFPECHGGGGALTTSLGSGLAGWWWGGASEVPRSIFTDRKRVGLFLNSSAAVSFLSCARAEKMNNRVCKELRIIVLARYVCVCVCLSVYSTQFSWAVTAEVEGIKIVKKKKHARHIDGVKVVFVSV